MKKDSDWIGLTDFRISWLQQSSFNALQSARMHHDDVRKAREQLLTDAQTWLSGGSFSVMNKKVLPPSCDRHDYMSLSIYHWPNPNSSDGLPYITRDGHVNPEIADYDRPAMAQMVQAVETLALCYAITAMEEYAAKAVELLHVWFVDPETHMNPNMLYAQYIPGHGGFDRPARYPAVYVPGVDGQGIYVAFGGVIEGVRLIPLVNIIPLLEGSSSWNQALSTDLREWFRQFLFWLLEHQHGKDEAGCLNNHGSWYVAQIMAYALFTGESEIARRYAMQQARQRIAMQIEPDGSMPEELGRAQSFHYVIYCLTSFVTIAQLAESIGIDLWHYSTEDGRGVRQALEWFIPYVRNPSAWPYRMSKPIDDQLIGAVPLLQAAYEAYHDPLCLEVKEQLDPYPDTHRYRLLY